MSGPAEKGPRTLLDYVQVTAAFLGAKGVDNARLDAELLLAEVVGMTRTQIYTNFEKPLAPAEIDRYRELVRRRAAREPVAYITGRREFWSLDLAVDRRVLVPRPETELVVEVAIDALKARRETDSSKAGREMVMPNASRDVDTPKADRGLEASSAPASNGRPLLVADIGTGSGAIAIAIAKEIPDARVIATDRSEAALEIAPGNAARHGVEGRIEFRTGDGCAPLHGAGSFDVIASNPPYVRKAEMATLAPEVRDWEPRWALESGPEGMDVTAPLVDEAFELLAPGGSLVVEVGTQSALVRDCFVRRGYEAVAVRRDLAGLERVVTGKRPK